MRLLQFVKLPVVIQVSDTGIWSCLHLGILVYITDQVDLSVDTEISLVPLKYRREVYLKGADLVKRAIDKTRSDSV